MNSWPREDVFLPDEAQVDLREIQLQLGVLRERIAELRRHL